MIDDHAHPFPLEFTPLELDRLSLDVGHDAAAAERRRALAPGRLSVHLLTAALADLLGVDLGDAVEARDARARSDWAGWVRHLFDDAGITGMILDEAVPAGRETGAGRHADLARRPVWHMSRIDPLVDELIEAGASAREIVERVESSMTDAAAAGCVAYKTILAYRTGLAVDPTADLVAGQRSLDDTLTLPTRRRGKALRDLVTRVVLGRAADLGKPVQVHTGFGDSELRLAESNPTLLEEVLRTREGEAATVVLIHGSFPWHAEAAYLASSKPNVWVELSLSNLFAPAGTADRLLAILDVAPRGRVLLGSDGHGNPETHWFGCRVLRESWRAAAARLLAAGARPGWVEQTRQAVFEDNARSLYGLPMPAAVVAANNS